VTLYALRPDPVTGAVDEEAEVVAQSKHGWQDLEEAVTLWRLVKSPRADEIDAVLGQVAAAAGDGELRIYAQELQKLVHLLTGIEDAVVRAGVVDKDWRVSPDRLEDLARQVPGMDLKTERTLDDKTYALGEVLNHAESIRGFLSNALEAGCIVVLG
jgi:hypothetical protein